MSERGNAYSEDRGFRSGANFLIRRSGLIAVIVVVVILGGALYIQGFATVPSGYRGVLLTWGKVENKILPEGLNFIIPFMQNIELMNVQVQKAESTESTATFDLQEVSTTVAVNFRLRFDKVNEIYRELRQDYVDRVIKPNIEESLKAATSQYRAEDLIKRRPEVKATLDAILAERLAVFNIDLVAVSLTDFQFSSSFAAAIEAKVTAEQRALEAQNQLEQIRYEAQQQIIQAEAEKNATIARSQGEAEAVIISASARSQAIELITSSMTPEYAQYLWLEQWDGKLPYVLGEGQSVILDVNALLDQGD
jgi:regulator of protease activity HflC (stomatin/prohibitin superfamily)